LFKNILKKHFWTRLAQLGCVCKLIKSLFIALVKYPNKKLLKIHRKRGP